MVDLRDALRPFVDEAAAGPRRPVAEVAERAAEARRRRIRRGSVVAGLAALVVAGGLILVDPFAGPDRSSQVSVADPGPATTAPTTTASPPPSSSSTTAPTTEAPTTSAPETTATTAPAPPVEGDAPLVSLVDGVVATSTTTSSWEAGRCVEVLVENTTAAPVEWKVRYALGGTIATLWSAVADDQGGGVVEFTGEDGYNRQLAAGASTTFGTCVDT